MLDVVNLQKKVKIETAVYKEFVSTLVNKVEEARDSRLTVAFISDDRMKQLNSLFRNKETTTDVLSFPHEPDEFEPKGEAFLGDIVISVEQAQKQAAENGLSLEGELKQLILHGLLHLCGYDHETDSGEMNERELALRKAIKI